MKPRNQSHEHKSEQHSPGNAAQFESLLRSGMDDLLVKTSAHQDAWGLGREQQWFLDRGSGELIFTFPKTVVSMPAQVIGRFTRGKAVWTWAWADESIPEHLRVHATRVRAYGMEHGFQHLVAGCWQAEESHCWYMTALACWVCGAQGAYRAADEDGFIFLTFGEVTTSTLPDITYEPHIQEFLAAAVEDFKSSAGSELEQRLACCRYLRRGTESGLDQSELIHHLGLATPSVLDLAGYSSDSAQNVLDLLKTISDDDIAACPVH